MPTERLYYSDSRLLDFDAQVVEVIEHDRHAAVILDRTAFYPTGGGQPNDTGTLANARVVDCVDDDAAGVLHVIEGDAPQPGETVQGRVDWLRRLDHMQQHTGQHILSGAFVKHFDAPTRSFRVLERECEIDVELNNPKDARIEEAVDLANQIIWDNRAIQIKQVTSAEAAAMPLRKESAREGELRLIEIDGFDLTPCGGTHARATGEIGVIVVRSWERAKGIVRIRFMAGVRAVADYRVANKTAAAVAELFSSGREDSPALVARLIEENKKLARRARELGEVASKVEADQLLTEARGASPTVREGSAIIARTFIDRDAESLKQLALALIAHPNTIALLGSKDGDTARLVFARSADANGDMNSLMREACGIIGGRGGGRPEMAQGGGPNAEKLDEAIDIAKTRLS